jgi:ribonuclease J
MEQETPSLGLLPGLEARFLGGIGEVGRNSTVLAHRSSALVIDCGAGFPPGGHGDLLAPRYDAAPEAKVEALVLTHGHLDHIGSIGELVEQLVPAGEQLPVYGRPFPLALLYLRAKEAGAEGRLDLRPLEDGGRATAGPFEVELVPMAHSIPEACGLIVRTPAGVVVHSGDFKLDPAPPDRRASGLDRLAEVARTEGVDALLSDSTNAAEADQPRSGREADVADALARLVEGSPGKRVVVTCFSSNLYRVAAALKAAAATGRTVVAAGRSLETTIGAAEALRLRGGPWGTVLRAEQARRLDPEETILLVAGSQGEPGSGLSRLIKGDRLLGKAGPGDVVIFSSSVIPGNEEAVARTVQALRDAGATVVQPGTPGLHASGHAGPEELAELAATCRPRVFVPVHGTEEMLVAHGEIAADATSTAVVVPFGTASRHGALAGAANG